MDVCLLHFICLSPTLTLLFIRVRLRVFYVMREFREEKDGYDADGVLDRVQLGVDGYVQRYYEYKFGASSPQEIRETQRKVAFHYVEVCMHLFR